MTARRTDPDAVPPSERSRRAPAAPAVPDESRAPGVPFPIVGVGASAGGLEACKQLLAVLPGDTGMAFVFVLHLDPSHQSMLAEILARSTPMPVVTVTDHLRVEANHVYVIPPAQGMVVSGGELQLSPRVEHRRPPRAIDEFLASLSRDQGHQSIAVILSGTATDGTLGCEEVKAEGGITFAQDDTAQQNGMPRSAVASGCIDFVLPPDEIAREIVRISRHPYVTGDGDRPEDVVLETNLGGILELLRGALGTDFSQYKRSTLYRRIARRMLLNKIEGYKDYVRFLLSHPEEVEALYQDILIGVTSFFRGPDTFEALKTHVFPTLIESRSRHIPVRMWVLGCSTGEEAYSLAIAFAEFADALGRAVPVQIFATDVNAVCVEKARAGLYAKSAVQNVEPERLRRYFVETDGGYRVTKSIRAMVVFARHNALTDPPFSRIDLITCRNLLIYLEPEAQRRFFPVIYYALAPQGFLALGNSETVGKFRDRFDLVDAKHKIYRKQATAESNDEAIRRTERSRFIGPAIARPRDQLAARADPYRDADRVLLARYSPAGVLVNTELEVVQFRGDTGPFLTPAPGRATHNLLKMLREGLLVAVRGAIEKAKRDEAPVRQEDLRVKSNGGYRTVNLEVIPVRNNGEPGFLILFEEPSGFPRTPAARASRSARSASPSPGQETQTDEAEREAERIKQELAATREYLQSVIEQQEAANEELQSANEEIQSSNEELQSVNEELETSKEELQSSNEELATVNDELNQRNDDLTRSNNDLNNLIDSVQMAIVMLGSNLRIRRYTPAAAQLLRLIPSDVGRPMSDLKSNVAVADLEELARQVIDTETPIQREVRDRDGKWYSLRIRPYRTTDKGIEGAVLALVDVDDMKRAEESARSGAQRLRIMQDEAPVGIVETDADGRFLRVNDRYCEITGYSRAELLEHRMADLVAPEDRAESAEDYRRVYSGETTAYRREERYITKAGDVAWLELHGFAVRTNDGNPAIGVGIVEDITERKHGEQLLRESEARFQMLADSTPVLIWVRGARGRSFANRAYRDFLGVGATDLRGDEWEQFLHPDDQRTYAKMYQQALDGREGFESIMRLRRSDGEYRWMKSIAAPRFTPEGEFLGLIGSSVDITDLKMAEESLREADRNKNRFLAVLAHELRGPLAPLRNTVQLLDADAGKDKVTWARDVMERQIKSITRMVDDLLDVGRLTQGKIQLRREQIELRNLVKGAVDLVQPLVDSRNQVLTLDLPDEPVFVHADPFRLEQVVGNLLNNASKFTPALGHIWVTVQSPPQRRGSAARDAEIRVLDDGQGIDSDILPHIFEPFVQAEHSIDRRLGGLGIGLTLVKSLVEFHGGTVTASTGGAGHGSEFVVRLPTTAKETPRAAAPASQSSSDGNTVSRRILVVDDNADSSETLAMLLRQIGNDVRLAEDGATAERIASEFKPEVALLDIGLPGMDGFEVARRLRVAFPSDHLVLVAISGYGQDEDRRRARTAGFDQYFTKPVGFDTLRDFLATLPVR